ncbi:hypothetical protein GW17_00021663 [Ensete ventricosum]|nr:hypothetical protein GW17_00021663 [Ensete ventricosum]
MLYQPRFSIPIYIAHTRWYVPVRQVIGTRTARYRAVPPKSIVGGRLREKKGRRRRKKKEERRGEEERIPRVVLARAPSLPAGRPRAAATLARGSPACHRRPRPLVAREPSPPSPAGCPRAVTALAHEPVIDNKSLRLITDASVSSPVSREKSGSLDPNIRGMF